MQTATSQKSVFLQFLGRTSLCLTDQKPQEGNVHGGPTPLWVSNYTSYLLCSGQVAHQAGAYPGFRSMKRLRVFLLPPGWDASPSQGYPPALNSPVPIYTPGWREAP